MEISTIRDGLASALDAIDGLRGLAYMPDLVNPPLAVVGGPSIDFDLSMARGADAYQFPVFLFVSRASDRAAEAALDQYIASSGAKSVKTVLEAATISGVDFVAVRSMQDYGVLQIANNDFLGCQFTVEVVA